MPPRSKVLVALIFGTSSSIFKSSYSFKLEELPFFFYFLKDDQKINQLKKHQTSNKKFQLNA